MLSLGKRRESLGQRTMLLLWTFFIKSDAVVITYGAKDRLTLAVTSCGRSVRHGRCGRCGRIALSGD